MARRRSRLIFPSLNCPGFARVYDVGLCALCWCLPPRFFEWWRLRWCFDACCVEGLVEVSGAGACCPAESVDRQSTAAKTNRRMRFTRISLGKSPVGRIQAQSEPKVRRKKEEAGMRVAKEKTTGGSAAEPGLHHVDHRVLLGYHLGLPHQRDGHQAHRKDAQSESQTQLCLRSRYTKDATHPSHRGPQEL